MNQKTTECRICGHKSQQDVIRAKEKHFGTFDEFEYFNCSNCDTLQIIEIPQNLSEYYPDNYYSKLMSKNSFLKDFLKKSWFRHSVGNSNIIGSIIESRRGKPYFYEWLKYIKLNHDSSILDVGSGIGHLLADLELAGFKDLTGVDPYLEKTIIYNDKRRVIKSSLIELLNDNITYDFIMFNYSFEHLTEPGIELKNARKLQNLNGKLMIRIPVNNSYVWENYHTDWVQLDAPRHLQILSDKSMELLAHNAGYKIEKIIYDSTDFQFWGSELFKHNIPLTATRLGSKNPMEDFRDIISEEKSREFIALTEKLNNENRGDQATFFMKAI